MYKPPKLTQGERENLNRLTARKEIESATKNLPKEESPDQMALLVNFTNHLKEQLMLISLLKLLQKD